MNILRRNLNKVLGLRVGFRWSNKGLQSNFCSIHMASVVLRSHKILTQSQIHICHNGVISLHSPLMSQSLLKVLWHSWTLKAYQSHLQTSNTQNNENKDKKDLNMQHIAGGSTASIPKKKKPKSKCECTGLKNLLKHPEWSGLSRRLIRLLVLLQHLVNLWICCDRRPLACLRWLWRSSAKKSVNN